MDLMRPFRSKLSQARQDTELAYLELELEQSSLAQVMVQEAAALSLEDADEADWRRMGIDPSQGLPAETLESIRAKCRDIGRIRPTGRGLVRTMQKYIIGREGMTLRVEGVEEDIVKLILTSWRDWERRNNWWKRQLEAVKRGTTDGEVWLRYFPGEDGIKLRFMNPDYVRDTSGKHSYGIETEPDDVETILRVFYCPANAENSVPIEASEINFLKTEVESDVKRGLPLLYTLRRSVNRYDTWLEYRMALNKARAAIVLLRTHEATPGQIRSFKAKQRTEQKTDKKGNLVDVERLRPGTKIDVPAGVKYEFLAPNVQAGDVAADGRAVLLQIAAGAGLCEFMVSADASNANYASTMVAEGPAVRELELWQGEYGHFFTFVAEKWRDAEVEVGRLPIAASQAVLGFVGPRIVTRDPEAYAKSNETLYNNRVKSRKTWREEEGLDDEDETRRFEQEEEGEAYGGEEE